MSSLQQQITDDLKSAMKERDTMKVSVFRMITAAMKNMVIDTKVDELSDQDVLKILKKELKQKHESLEQFEKAKRDDLAREERLQITVLEQYLPAELSEDVVLGFVDEAIAAAGATSMADMGNVMKELMPKLQGQYDGKRAQALVVSKLK